MIKKVRALDGADLIRRYSPQETEWARTELIEDAIGQHRGRLMSDCQVSGEDVDDIRQVDLSSGVVTTLAPTRFYEEFAQRQECKNYGLKVDEKPAIADREQRELL
jgi:hypothetical protein